MDGQVRIEQAQTEGSGTAPLSMEASAQGQLSLQLTYEASRFAGASIERLGASLAVVLADFARHPESTLESIQRHLVLADNEWRTSREQERKQRAQDRIGIVKRRATVSGG